ncbi:MAG: response regulator [Thermodesulfobacteriota bacterium]|nr:response regulator [Thermodesulfobacteriota bacterium]
MKDKKTTIDDWMVRITFAEAGEPEAGFKITGDELKTRLALDRVMVIKSEKQSALQQEGEMKLPNHQKEESNSQNLQVMVLDDEPIVGKRLKPALEKSGFDVEFFLESKKALARLNEKEFDIVVTDLRMEDVDGIQVLEYIMEKCKNTRVILITGYATVEVAREALVKGAFDFIAKPFKPRDLRAVVNKAALSLGHKGIPL